MTKAIIQKHQLLIQPKLLVWSLASRVKRLPVVEEVGIFLKVALQSALAKRVVLTGIFGLYNNKNLKEKAKASFLFHLKESFF